MPAEVEGKVISIAQMTPAVMTDLIRNHLRPILHRDATSSEVLNYVDSAIAFMIFANWPDPSDETVVRELMAEMTERVMRKLAMARQETEQMDAQKQRPN